MRDRHVYGLAAVLTVIGVGYFLYKVLVLGLPLSFHAKTDLWEVETALTFEAKGEPVRLAFQIPKDDVNFSIVNQSFVSRGYGISTEEGAAGNRRQTTISGTTVAYQQLGDQVGVAASLLPDDPALARAIGRGRDRR